MANSSSLLKQIALSRLTALGCEMLPPAVSKLVVSSFVERAEQRLTRLARREITVPKIAKLFTQGLAIEGESKGETAVSHFGEAGPSNEVSHGP
jgi:hypothetical protein